MFHKDTNKETNLGKALRYGFIVVAAGTGIAVVAVEFAPKLINLTP